MKIAHHARASAFAKSSLCVKNLNSKKHVNIHSTNHLQLFWAKKKHPKTTKYPRNDTILKIGHHAKAKASKKSYFRSNIKIPKNMSEYVLQIIYSCSVQKTPSKTTKYSRNETILKIGHHAKAIAFTKSSLCIKD